MADIPVVMISSTTLDLDAHRPEVRDACLRVGMMPKMMEYLPANDDDAIANSRALVDEADIYLGIFAFRYGHIPKGRDKSITHLEYEYAVEQGKTCLLFFMDDEHQIKPGDVETGDGAEKLKQFKEGLREGGKNFIPTFKSPEELRAHVIQALERVKNDLDTADDQDPRAAARAFHYVTDIPQAPEPYIAHPYTLLRAGRLIGRREELAFLTDWVTGVDTFGDIRIMNLVALGGVGKSALAWTFFQDVLPHEMASLAGRVWWSFYESDATFDNFVLRTLSYVSGETSEHLRQELNAPEREAHLLAHLADKPYFLVLDGLERLLIAYARMDASRLADDEYDQQTANFVAGVYNLPSGSEQSFTGQHRLRATADLRAGQFLRKLAALPIHGTGTHILITTRLYPFDLQRPNREPAPGCAARFLRGLTDNDALDLWREHGASGARQTLLPLFQRFDNHPLLIQALAGEVADNPGRPGDFDDWRSKHPDFDPFAEGLRLVQVKSHVLYHALAGLGQAHRRVLHTLAAFRLPATYDTQKRRPLPVTA